MKERSVDVAILGTGTAGMSAYRTAVAHTESVALIERGPYGTTCARVGCMPSKLLLAAAEAAQAVREAHVFGVGTDAPRIDGAAVMDRVRSERDRFVGFVTEAVEKWPADRLLRGEARFLDDHRIQVGSDLVLAADRIVIATGSRPRTPPQWSKTLGDRLIVNDDVFEWKALPAAVAVVGMGAIGLELALALTRLGVRVRLYGRGGAIASLTDPEVRKVALAVFAREVAMEADAGELRVDREGDEVVIGWGTGAQAKTERFDYLLAAVGRIPNVDSLGLEHTSLPLDEHGVPRFDRTTAQVGDSHVFIAGDAGDDHPLLHEAADQGRIAGDNAGRFPDVRASRRQATFSIVFTDPQIVRVGESHAELVSRGASFAIGEVSFDDQGRARVLGKNRGLLRVYGEHGTGLFLGAEMIAPAGEHLGHLLAWSQHARRSVQAMLDSPFYHPCIEEGLRTALRQLARALHMGPAPVAHCLDCGPGA
jgi:dihydrolipoamide dehydrogenase